MKNKTTVTLLITTLICLLTTSTLVNAINYTYNADTDNTSTTPEYMSENNSAKSVASIYGNLLNDEYGWSDPWGNTAERNGFNPGPAPDRADVLYRTSSGLSIPKVLLGSTVATDVNNPYVNTITQAVIAFDGQLFCGGTIRVNSANTTIRNALLSLDPLTGEVNWASIIGYGPTSGMTLSTCIFKVDDTHIAIAENSMFLSGGLSMWSTDGRFLWYDNRISPNSVYRASICVGDPVYMIYGALKATNVGTRAHMMCAWSLADPDIDKGNGGRSVWNYTIDEAGDAPIMAYGDGLLYMGSYSPCAVYALNATTGEKVWECFTTSAMGYTGAYSDGRLYVGCQSCQELCLNGTNGEVIWVNTDGLSNRGFNVYCINVAYGRVYYHDLGSGRSGAMKCYDINTGEKLWASIVLQNIGYYTTVIGDGKIYGMQSDGSTTTGREADPLAFMCWDAFTGEELWSLEMSISMPVLAYGCLYFIHDGQLWCISTAAESSQDWAMYRGNVETPGFTLDLGPTDISNGPKWTFTTGASIISQPVVADGKLIVTSCDRYVYCIDAYNGSFIWKFETNEEKMTTFGSTPAIADGKVYIAPEDGNFYVLDLNTGDELNRVSMGTYKSADVGPTGQANIRSSPIIYNNKVYVGSLHNNKTYCLDLDGNVEWATTLGGEVVGTAAISDGYIYILAWDSMIYKLSMTGDIVFSFTVDTTGTGFFAYAFKEFGFTPTIVGDRLWLGCTGQFFRCYNITTGEEIYMTQQPYVASEHSHGGVVYVPDWAITTKNVTSGETFDNIGGTIIGQAGPTLACARADNGSNIWSNWGGWEIWGTPVVSGIGDNAVAYIGSDSYSIQVVDASTGLPISWYTTGGNIVNAPAIWDGKLYVGSYDNKIYCFEDHANIDTTINISIDKTTMNVNNLETVTVTTQLTGVNDNSYDLNNNAITYYPPLPDASILVTVTDPTGAETDLTATTDNYGHASVTIEPDMVGNWSVIAWYEGKDKPTCSYLYAFSDMQYISVTETDAGSTNTIITTVTPETATLSIGESVILTASVSGGTPDYTYKWYQIINGATATISGETSSTLTVTPTAEGTYGYFCEVTDTAGQVDSSDTAEVKVGAEGAGSTPMEYIYAIVAVIVIVVISVVVYMVIKKRK
ncbi:MAG: PQQ-binding-like beta-propeller repeat protein [Candidatus Bathyarchaeota archaeon]|nr:PQQ-binding-like beta-propeller repeat protein [Candidatus Bathyarchaeum sp.]